MGFQKKIHILRISPILFLLWAGFIYSYAEDIPKTTKVTISTSGPVEYQHYIKEDPPAIVIEFKSKNVFTYWEGVMAVNRGVIKEIHTEYYSTKANEPSALKSLIFILSKKASYNIDQTKDAIVIEIENPPLAQGEELSLGEIEIPGKFGSEFDIQKKEALDKAISEAKQKLEKPQNEFQSNSGDVKNTITQIVVSEEKVDDKKIDIPIKAKSHTFFYFLMFPVFILLGGYFLWMHRTRRETKPQVSKKEQSNLLMEKIKLQQELDKVKGEKHQLETKLAEKENLEKRLLNIELLESQLRKTKTDLEEASSLRQQLEKRLKVMEKESEEKSTELESVRKDAQERESNLRNELETKEELIKQLSDEKELLKIEVVKMNTQLKKEVNIREELEKNLKEKEKAMEILSAATIEKVPKEEALKENKIDEQLPEEKRKSPRLELAPLGDKGILLRLATSNKDEPYLIGVVKNVSSGGIMAELDKELLPSDTINMDLIEHGSFSPIGVLGKLIWQQKQVDSPNFKVGISFFSLSQDSQERINEYIKKVEDLSKK